MTEHDKEACKVIYGVRKYLKSLEQKIKEGNTIFPEILNEQIKSLLTVKVKLQMARNRDSELFINSETPNTEKFREEREAREAREARESQIFQESEKIKKKKISYSRV